MLCAMFGCYWPSGSGKEDFKILSMYFRYNLPLEKLWLFIWSFVPSLVEIGPMEDENVKSWQTDEQQVIRKASLSFQLRWA